MHAPRPFRRGEEIRLINASVLVISPHRPHLSNVDDDVTRHGIGIIIIIGISIIIGIGIGGPGASSVQYVSSSSILYYTF